MKFGNTDGFGAVDVRDVKEFEGIPHWLSNKQMFNLNICPRCNSDETFHHLRLLTMENRLQEQGIPYENVYRTLSEKRGNSWILAKYDLCLKCSNEWVFQIFCWDRLDEYAIQLAPRADCLAKLIDGNNSYSCELSAPHNELHRRGKKTWSDV